MVGIRLNNTIVVDTVEERESLVERFKGSHINPQLLQKQKNNNTKEKRIIEIKVNEKKDN